MLAFEGIMATLGSWHTLDLVVECKFNTRVNNYCSLDYLQVFISIVEMPVKFGNCTDGAGWSLTEDQTSKQIVMYVAVK